VEFFLEKKNCTSSPEARAAIIHSISKNPECNALLLPIALMMELVLEIHTSNIFSVCKFVLHLPISSPTPTLVTKAVFLKVWFCKVLEEEDL
jgi:hypothetical protein